MTPFSFTFLYLGLGGEATTKVDLGVRGSGRQGLEQRFAPLGELGVQVQGPPHLPDSWGREACSARVAGRPHREILCCFCPWFSSIKMVTHDNSHDLG